MLSHYLRSFSLKDLENYFETDMLYLDVMGTSHDIIPVLCNSVEKIYSTTYVEMDGGDCIIDNIYFGFQVVSSILVRKKRVSEKDFYDVLADPAKYGVTYNGNNLEDIPFEFRRSNHNNGQAKNTMVALETLVAAVELGVDGKMVVIGSSSPNINSGGSYHVMGYVASVLKYTLDVSMYDPFETSMQFNIGTSTISTHSTYYDYESIGKYNVVIDDAWSPDDNIDRKSHYDGKVYSVKKFVRFPNRLQPFFNNQSTYEVRETSFRSGTDYRGVCYFDHNHRACYECSHVEALISRIAELIRIRNVEYIGEIDRFKGILRSWIYRYNSSSKHLFMYNNYHLSLFRVYLATYRRYEINLGQLESEGLCLSDISAFYRYRDMPRVPNKYSPENMMYSLLQFTQFTRVVRFSCKYNTSDLDIYAEKYLERIPYVILGEDHHHSNDYQSDHVILCSDLRYYRDCERMNSLRPKGLVYVSRNKLSVIPVTGFCSEEIYDAKFKKMQHETNRVRFWVYRISESIDFFLPMGVFLQAPRTLEGIDKYLRFEHSIKMIPRSIRQVLVALESYISNGNVDELKVIMSQYGRLTTPMAFDVRKYYYEHGFYKTTNLLREAILEGAKSVAQEVSHNDEFMI